MRYKLAALTLVTMMLLSMFTVLMVPNGSADSGPQIAIRGDEDLEGQAHVYNWPGSGTSDDPYVISGLNIGGNNDPFAISLEEVSLFLTIKDCTISGFVTGIHLSECTNIVLRNNTVTGLEGSDVISIDKCRDISVVNNTISNGSCGIRLSSGAHDDVVFGNRISGTDDGIAIGVSCESNVVANNTMLDIRSSSIYVDGPRNLFTNNTITGDINGIYLEMTADDCVVENNTITYTGDSPDSGHGIVVLSTGARIIGNVLEENSVLILPMLDEDIQETIDSYVIEGNTVNGDPVVFYRNQDLQGGSFLSTAGEIIAMNVTNAHVYGSTVAGGVLLIGSSHIDVESIQVSGNTFGAALLLCDNCSISGNRFMGIAWYGAMVAMSSNIVVADNNVTGAPDDISYGSYVAASDNVTVENNRFSTLNTGADQEYGTSDCAIRNNTISDCDAGIRLYETSNVTVDNNTVDGCDDGIGLEYSSENALTNNRVADSVGYGMDIYHSGSNTIQGNHVTGSRSYGIYVNDSDGSNLFYENRLSGNNGATFDHDSDHVQAFDDSADGWDYGGVGNYWADWQSPDEDEDGVVDLPYVLDGEGVQDSFPMMVDFSPDVPVVSVDIITPSRGSYQNSSSLTASWSGGSVSGIVSYWVSVDGGAWISVELNTTYEIPAMTDGAHILGVRAQDRDGNWNQAGTSFVIDTIAPTIVDKGPIGNDVALDAAIGVMFSEAMDKDSTTVSIIGVTGTISWSGNHTALTPSSALSYATVYTVMLSGKDLAGNVVEESWTFTTLENKGSISGIALDPSGQPLEDATVTLSNGMTTTTDPTGFFRFDDVPSGTYTVTIIKDSYTMVMEGVSTTAGNITQIGLVRVQGTTGMADTTLLVLAGAAVAVVIGSFFVMMWKRKSG